MDLSVNDGFILVKSKRKNNKLKNGMNKPQSLSLNECEVDENKVNRLVNTINNYKYQLLNDNYDEKNYWKNLNNMLNNFIESILLDNKDRKINIRCYGLGSIEDNYSARYQFALLLLIYERFKAYINSIYFYDPIFNANDKFILTDVFKFNILTKNDECKYNILNDLKELNLATLFYMPHCCKSLYNNLLYSNWSYEALNNLYLFSNSFKLIYDYTLEDILIRNYKYLLKSKQFLNEYYITNSDLKFTDAFSDLSLIKFRPLSNSDVFLVNLGVPVYDYDDEIVLNK